MLTVIHSFRRTTQNVAAKIQQSAEIQRFVFNACINILLAPPLLRRNIRRQKATLVLFFFADAKIIAHT